MIEQVLTQPIEHLIIIAIAAISFIIQLSYWLSFTRIALHRHRRRVNSPEELPPVSVIVIVGEDMDFIENNLPVLLAQEYPEFEVVVVNDCGGEDITLALWALSQHHPNLKYTTIKDDPRFKHSRKIPLTIGIKAARYENMIFTDPDSLPESPKWLSMMARGFNGAEIVIGYTAIEQQKGLRNKWIRSSRLLTSIRYLNSAIKGRTYRGIYNNIGYTKNIFFRNKGFNHQRLSLGEDDLFIQHIATRKNVSVIINPTATMHQNIWNGSWRWWWNEEKYRTYSYRYYPKRVKFSLFFEPFTRFLLFLSVFAVLALLLLNYLEVITTPIPLYLWVSAVAIFVVRFLIVLLSIKSITKRLGEKRLNGGYMIYDFLSPITNLLLALSRRIRPSEGLWK